MAKFPSMPVFTDAYIADTTHLSAEEHGVYFLLLVCAWRSPGCRLKKDDTQLARMGRVTPAKWRKIKDTILAFWSESDGYIKQKKLTEIYEKVQKNVEQKKQAGIASAEAKALKDKETSSTAVDEPPQRPANGQPTNQNQNQSITPIPTNVGKPPTKEKADGKRASRITEDWWPSPELARSVADKEGFTLEQIEHEVYQFRNHWLAASGKTAVKRSWDAGFRKWCGQSYCDSRQGVSGAGRRGGGSQGAVQSAESFEKAARQLQTVGTDSAASIA